MAVSAEQIESWTSRGSQDSAVRTHQDVRAALAASPAMGEYTYEVFLQGSYANVTNTRGDSDVDIVVLLTCTFIADSTMLTVAEAARLAADLRQGETSPWRFRHSVRTALCEGFGADNVLSRNKCLSVPKRPGRVDADVVSALQRRRFTHYPAPSAQQWLEGIEIRPLAGPAIVNYPKVHLANGRRKNDSTGGQYKPTVRQVKRLRRLAVERGLVRPEAAPGYLLECMVYNAPGPLFVSDDVVRLRAVIDWLAAQGTASLRTMWSCDEIHRLFIDDPGRLGPHRWGERSARAYRLGARGLPVAAVGVGPMPITGFPPPRFRAPGRRPILGVGVTA